ncbi:switch-associated protein 70 [Dorcoceras hygrometricum]|uniref:Switch-associated protein 70 n=1 Tax=Dorcoceras hygrometricum TaxID=472368 RepID=A0A2Z7CUF5_9LAMI|nr:switch-associated protein 70 [Dorcoceras hygrometricum]
MVDRTTRRAKGFATQICVFLKGDPTVTLGESKTFPPLKILSEKTVNTYVATNKKIDARGETDEPDVATVAFVKKKSVSKKRPATVSEAPVVKKKRTSSGKAVSKEKDLDIVSVALDAEPIQTVDHTSAMPAAHPPAPKRRAPKRKLRMAAGFDDEFVEKESAMEPVVIEQKATTSVDDVDTIIEEVIAATAQMEQADFVESAVAEGIEMETVLADPVVTKSDDILVKVDDISAAVTDKEDFEPLSKFRETSMSPISDEESLTIEEHLAQIPEGMMLPSLTSAEPTKINFCSIIEIRGVEDGYWYRAHLPKIAANDKGNGSLVLGTRTPEDLYSYDNSSGHSVQEARRTNLVSGLPTTSIDQRTLDLISAAHQEAVRNLLRQMSAHGLKWTRPVSSMLFEEPNLERCFYIPRNHKSIFSTCWLRNLRKIEGSWVVEEGFDLLVCKCTKCVSSNWPSLPVRVSITDIYPICLFFKPAQGMDSQLPPVKSWGWYMVCIDILRYSMFGCLKPVCSFNVCTDIVLIGPVMGDFSIPRRVVYNVSYRIQILDSALPDFSEQISPFVDFTSASTDFVLYSPHQSSSSASSMHFTDVSASFSELRASISRLIANKTRDYRRLGDSHAVVLSKIEHLEKEFLNTLSEQDQDFRGMIKNIRQEARNDADVFSMKLEAARTQNVILKTEIVDARQEVKAQKADLFKEIDESLATIRSEKLDFRAQAQENYNTLSTQLCFLVDYINRGGDTKKGEGGSSHPQPPPDDQNRTSGGSASKGTGSGGSSRRDDKRGSSKRRSSSGGGGSGTGGGPYGPYKKDVEWWLYGKNQF